MATGPITRLSDVIVPEIFTPYVQQMTEQKSRILMSGAMTRDPLMDSHLSGGGLTFNTPSFRDLDDDDENISSDEADDRFVPSQNTNSSPMKIGTAKEISVRLSRNQSWSSADLAAALIGTDPMEAIANRVSDYWTRRLQKATVATIRGVFANNNSAPTGAEHIQGDMTNDLVDDGAGGQIAYAQGVTDFSDHAFLDAAITMGDSMDDLGLVLVHSIVYNRMLKNKLIDRTVIDPVTNLPIPTFLGRIVVVDDGMPASGGVYETWMFGGGALRFGSGSAKVPTETKRDPDAGQGGGAEILYNRVEWAIHPSGHKYIGAADDGGPSNAATTNNLAHEGSWQRVFSERKQVKMARLVTREA